MILLDPNVVSALMLRQPDPVAVGWLDARDPSEVWLPSVVVFELRFGAANHPDANRRHRLKDALDWLVDQLIQERVGPLIMELDDPTLVNPVSS